MKASKKSPNRFATKWQTRKEQGLTIVETLVAIGLFAIVAVMTVSIVNTTMNSATRYSNVTASQTEVTNAAASMQRDLSNAQKVILAEENSVTISLRQSSKDYEVTFFAWDPASSEELPAGAIAADLPNYRAIVEMRKDISSGTVGQKVIVKGHNPEGFADTAKHHVFDYYDSENEQITPTSQAVRDTIDRIEFRISADAEGRGTPIQIESSASSTISAAEGANGGSDATPAEPACPINFKATILPTEREATLTWATPAGATSYTIYRTHTGTGATASPVVVSDPNATSYVDAGLAWGATYTWTITSSGTGGITTGCAPATATVVPERIGFVNENSLQMNLAAQKAGAGSETLSRASEAGIPAASVATKNVLANARYTVARNLVNQLAWSTSYGTVGYNVYDPIADPQLSTPLAQITSPSTQYTQLLGALGAEKTYVIKAYNAGGESIVSAEVTLVSPPLASTFTYSKPDSSARATTTDTVITLTNRAANTEGFRAYKYETATATVDCDALNATSSLNIVNQTSITDSNVKWGTIACYKFSPYNHAGVGAVSNDVTVKQLPRKFSVTSIGQDYNGTYQNIDINIALPAGAHCWVALRGPGMGTTNNVCDGGPNVINGYTRMPVGKFGTVDNKTTKINVIWSKSEGANGDYRVEKKRVATGGIVDNGNANQLINCSGVADCTAAYTVPYATAATQAVYFYNEMPGSEFQFRVTARAANGETRTSGTGWNTYVSSPDIPRYFQTRFVMRGVKYAPSAYVKIESEIVTGAVRGLATTTDARGETFRQGYRYTTGSFAANGARVWFDGPEYDHGTHHEYVENTLTRAGQYRTSINVNAPGWSSPGCSYSYYCAAHWTRLPDQYPNYWQGNSPRYHAGGQAAVSTMGPIGHVAAPDPTPPPAGEPVPDGVRYECPILEEDDPKYVIEWGCAYGEGIPPAPSSLVIASVLNNTVNLKWDAAANATGYKVSISTNGGTPVETTVTGTTHSAVVPYGSTVAFTVYSINDVNTSSKSSNTVSVPMPAAPTGVSFSWTNPTSGKVEWNSAANALSYIVYATINGTTTQYSTSATNHTVTVPSGATASFYVVGINGVYNSPNSSIVQLGAPSVPTGLAVNSTNGNVVTYGWNAASGASSYKLQVTINGTTTTTVVTGVTHEVTVPFGSSASVRVAATNSSGDSAYSAAVASSTVIGAPTNLRAVSVTGANTNIAWNASTGAASYKLTAVIDGVTTTYTTTGLTYALPVGYGKSGTVYVEAIAGAVTSGKSNVLNVSVVVGAPAASTVLATNTVSPNSVTPTGFSWSAITCAVGTPQYMLKQSSPSATNLTGWVTTLSQSISLTANTAYNVSVSTRCLEGTVASAETAGAALSVIPRYTAPSTPTVAPMTSAASYFINQPVTVTFASNTCYAGTTPTYNLYSNGGYVGSTTATTMNFTAPAAGTVHLNYTIACLSSGGVHTTVTSGVSPSRIITILAAPTAPTGVQVTGWSGVNSNVTWNAVAGATSYVVEVKVNARVIYTLPVTSNSATLRWPAGSVNETNTFRVQAVNGSGTSPQSTPVSITPPVGDYNGDGYPDLIATNMSTGAQNVYFGTGTGYLSGNRTMGGGWSLTIASVVNIDLNGDGNNDIVARDTSGSLWLYPGTSVNSMAPRILIDTGAGAIKSFSTAIDWNNDGFDDFLVTRTDGTAYAYLGSDRSGNPTTKVLFGSAGWQHHDIVAVGDFTNDGNADIITTAQNYLYTYPGVGDGGVRSYVFQSGGAGWGLAAMDHMGAADLNGDGNLDFIVRRLSSTTLQSYFGLGNGTITNGWATTGAFWSASNYSNFINVRDFDLDGDADVIARYSGNNGEYRFIRNEGGRFDSGSWAITSSGWNAWTVR